MLGSGAKPGVKERTACQLVQSSKHVAEGKQLLLGDLGKEKFYC